MTDVRASWADAAASRLCEHEPELNAPIADFVRSVVDVAARAQLPFEPVFTYAIAMIAFQLSKSERLSREDFFGLLADAFHAHEQLDAIGQSIPVAIPAPKQSKRQQS